MNYVLRKTLMVAILGPLAIVGALLALSAGLGPLSSRSQQVDSFWLIFGLMLAGISSYQLVTGYRRLTRFQTKTYDWYKTAHPENVHGKNVSCFSCRSQRITVRSLMQHTYHRAHICTACGTTLYYSPELG